VALLWGAAMASAQTQDSAVPAVPAVSAAPTRVTELHRQQPRQQKLSSKAKNHFVAAWGVDNLSVRYTASGNLIRFSYRVADAELAKLLSAKASTPLLVGQRNNVVLQVPVMDKVGPLRQAVQPKAGQDYWMVFSNKGNLVRPGDRVNIVIGAFHADGLMVE